MKKVNILGTEYKIKMLSEDEYPKLKIMSANGLAELYSKDLIIDSGMNKQTGKEFENFKAFENKTIRHEIIHAFFHESGLDDYGGDEDLVNWLSLQFPKILQAFKEADCL